MEHAAADHTIDEYTVRSSEVGTRLEIQSRYVLAAVVGLGVLAGTADTVIDKELFLVYLIASAIYLVLGLQYLEQERSIARAHVYLLRVEIKLKFRWESIAHSPVTYTSWSRVGDTMTSWVGVLRYLPTFGAAIGFLVAFAVFEQPAVGSWEYGFVVAISVGIVLGGVRVFNTGRWYRQGETEVGSKNPELSSASEADLTGGLDVDTPAGSTRRGSVDA